MSGSRTEFLPLGDAIEPALLNLAADLHSLTAAPSLSDQAYQRIGYRLLDELQDLTGSTTRLPGASSFVQPVAYSAIVDLTMSLEAALNSLGDTLDREEVEDLVGEVAHGLRCMVRPALKSVEFLA